MEGDTDMFDLSFLFELKRGLICMTFFKMIISLFLLCMHQIKVKIRNTTGF